MKPRPRQGNRARLHRLADGGRWELPVAFASFQITMLIVLAIGAGSAGLLVPASLGAVAALLLVLALGVAIYRPLASIPENSLKFVVGVRLSAFGTFWVGEGLGVSWPGGDWAIPGIVICFRFGTALTIRLCRQRVLQAAALVTAMERGHIAPILRELLGLFVDDARFALAILAWLTALTLLPQIPLPAWRGALPLADLVVILVWHCLRHVTHRARRTR